MAGWSKKPTGFIRVVEGDLAKKRTHIAMDALQAVISGSPVADGAYRANHRVTIDGEDHGFDASLGRGKDSEPSRGSLSTPSYEEGLVVLAGQAKTPYAEVTIQNNAPYAEELEGGHSKQAPDGVFRPAFATVRAKHSTS